MQNHWLLSLAAITLFPPGVRALQRTPEACDKYEAVVRADPNNLDAAASLGQCSVRDHEMVAPGGDSTQLMFRSSWSTALRALRHAVELDPGYARAYRPLFRILFADTRDGCSSVTGECRHVSPVLRVADSVITKPRPVHSNRRSLDSYEEAIRESQSTRRANLMEARALADRWASATPNDPRPHENLGRALLRLGEFEAATTALQRAATLGATERRTELFWDLLEALVKSDRGADARRLLDDAASDPGRDTTQIGNFALAGFNALLGRYRPPPVDSAALLRRRARIDSMLRSLPPPPPPPPTFSALLAAGDTAAARTTLARMDAHQASLEATRSFPRISPSHTQSAEYHLALGDTAVAEARLAEIERPLHEGMFRYSIGLMYGSWPPGSGGHGYSPVTWPQRAAARRRRDACIAGSSDFEAAVMLTCNTSWTRRARD